MVFPQAFKSYIPRSHCIDSHVYGAILITSNRETVVIRGRQTGKWSFPKGHGNSTERPLDACIRELKEETGIDMKHIKPDEELRFSSGTYFVFYLLEKPNLCPEDMKEVVDCIWIPIQRLSSLLGNKDIRSFCKEYGNGDIMIDKIESNRLVLECTQ
jgi:8-oxo-dGTP pyrophosphatase MutT (NUDIX family)